MNDIDRILASGRYTDRRGREWVRRLFLRPNTRWVNIIRDRDGIGWPGEKISDVQMRLLIERDQHRDVCKGLRVCGDHPVPHVVYYPSEPMFVVWDADSEGGSTDFATLPEAMGSARALAVGE